MIRKVLKINFSLLRDKYYTIVKEKKMHIDDRQLDVVRIMLKRLITFKDLRMKLRVVIQDGSSLSK